MTGPLDAVIPLLLLALPVGILLGMAFDSRARDWRRGLAAARMARIGILTTVASRTGNQARLDAYTAKRAGLLGYRLPWAGAA